MSSAKEKKGLNKVFHTAFKVVFQMKSMEKSRSQNAGGPVDPSRPPGPGQDGKGGCCGNKKKK